MKTLQKFGGIAALYLAAAYIVGMIGFLTVVDVSSVADPVQKVALMADNLAFLYILHLIVYVVWGIFMIILALALYERLKAGWGGYSGYDGWFARELNNARLNTIANYYDLVPGFERLLELNGDDLEAFYRAAERLKKVAKAERHERLRALAGKDAGPQR